MSTKHMVQVAYLLLWKFALAKDDVQTAHEDLDYDIMKNIDSNSPESPEQ